MAAFRARDRSAPVDREGARLGSLVLPGEMLLQEAVGLTVLCGALGARASPVHAVLACTHVAPCLTLLPGRAGATVRAAGWAVWSQSAQLARTARACAAHAERAGVIAAARDFERRTHCAARSMRAAQLVAAAVWRAALLLLRPLWQLCLVPDGDATRSARAT